MYLKRFVVGAALTFASFLSLPRVSSAVTTVVVNQNLGTTQSIIGITGFSTFGDDMAGMLVTAFFADGSSSATWLATGPGAGSAVASDFSLEEVGDTFASDWTLTNTSADPERALTRLVIDGIPGNTVFDRTFGGAFGTPDSARGLDFTTSYDPGFDVTVTATYVNVAQINGNAPVGDLFGSLMIDLGFGLFSPDDPFTFMADTDSVGLPPQVAEPSTLLLLGAGLVGIWNHRRRRG